MRKTLPAVAVAAAAALAVTGCKGTSHVSSGVKASASTEASAAASHEQTLIDQCLAKGTILTKNGRKAFYQCAAGNMTVASFEACATKQLTATSLLTKSGRDSWMLAVGKNCTAAS